MSTTIEEAKEACRVACARRIDVLVECAEAFNVTASEASEERVDHANAALRASARDIERTEAALVAAVRAKTCLDAATAEARAT